MITVSLPVIARTRAVACLTDLTGFSSQFLHQRGYLVARVFGDFPHFGISQAFLIPFGPLHQDTEHPGFGGIPADAAAGFTLAVFSQAVV